MSRPFPSRPTLESMAGHLAKLDVKNVEELTEERLWRRSAKVLPPLGRDEDPADVLVDTFHLLRKHGVTWTPLLEACGHLSDRWSSFSADLIRQARGPLGELYYLSARTGAVGAIRGMAHVIERKDLQQIPLSSGEDLQLRALRSLTGLLADSPETDRKDYRPLLERALDTAEHRLMGLTALVAFWPVDRESILRSLQSRHQVNVESLERQLDKALPLMG